MYESPNAKMEVKLELFVFRGAIDRDSTTAHAPNTMAKQETNVNDFILD